MNLSNIKPSILDSIARRAHYLATQMIYQANHRSDKEKGDPKVGGHPAASSSALHIMGALHLLVKSGFDHIANKPHASPTDHSYNYLLDLFLKSDLSKFSLAECNQAMLGLRAFSKNGEPVFQSYHSAWDPDNHNFFPSGTVGIPPVMAGYMALAYRFAKEHGYDVPADAHFWALMGDSEFREGSLFEAIPDFAEREIGNVTWIVDYNRQSLDGHRITNKKIMAGTDADRIERTMTANGWDVIQVRHGSRRKEIFKKPEGDKFKNWLEAELEDFELQSLLLINDAKTLKSEVEKKHSQLKKFLSAVDASELFEALRDFGGHDMIELAQAMLDSKKDQRRPKMIIAHTLKGWGLRNAAMAGNHSALPTDEEVEELRAKQGIKGDTLFARFADSSEEGKFLKNRGEELYGHIKAQNALKDKNQETFLQKFSEQEIPATLDLNIKMASYPHTQWMLGQITSKMTRIANTPADASQLEKGRKTLTPAELAMKIPAELMVSMAPDVGTSTNLNPSMDGKVFGSQVVDDFETEFGVRDDKLPNLVPSEEPKDRFLRFEIAECNAISCLGSFGRLRDVLGVPVLPLMTVYDFFVKRALDQHFYNLYWKSSFILVGTPSGVTLSPEGAQHGWKSDFQIPNQITWEPLFCQELDWIYCDAVKRHMTNDNAGRMGVNIRGVTRGIDQKLLLDNLRKQVRFKQDPGLLVPNRMSLPGATDESQVAAIDDASILEQVRVDVLQGAYYLINYAGYAGYEAGDNVVNIISMGSPTTEAIKASEVLLQKGIYANVIVVTSSDLVCGNLAAENDYSFMKSGLGLSGDLIVHPTEHMNGHEFITVAGKRTPIVSVHDGEPGLLDNLGSIIGVKQESLAVRKHSKCGRPEEIYRYHHLDADSIVEACGKVMSETALENVKVSQTVLRRHEPTTPSINRSELWQNKTSTHS